MDLKILKKAFPLSKSKIFREYTNFYRNDGWISNGVFLIKEKYEHKITKELPVSEKKPPFEQILKLKNELEEDQLFLNENLILRGTEYSPMLSIRLGNTKIHRWVNPYILAMVCESCNYDCMFFTSPELPEKPILIKAYSLGAVELVGFIMPIRLFD